MLDLAELLAFAIAAKKATYVGDGVKTESSRPGSHDLTFQSGDWSYRDSYFGGTDFLGQELIWFRGAPVWSMTYYGYIKRPDLIDATKAGNTLKAALTSPGSQGRLLDSLEYDGVHGFYRIRSSGDVAHFSGIETISVGCEVAYQLDYMGGLIKD